MKASHLFIALLFCTSVMVLRAQPEIVPGSYIIQVSHTEDLNVVAQRVIEATGGQIGHMYTNALWGLSVQLPPGIPKSALFGKGVLQVEEDLVAHVVAQTVPTGVNRIDAEPVAGTLFDCSNVDVAIIDTGIDIDHPDLNVVGGHHFFSVIRGRLISSRSDENYDDDNGHGTHVAGTVAAIDNDLGVVGIAPGAKLWAVKVLDSKGSGYMSDIIAGIDWVTARADTIEVANMSLGGVGKLDALRTAIQNSVAQGVVYTVAAGNDGKDIYGNDGIFNTSDDFIPAAYPEVATISALADSDGLAGGTGSGTSYGADDSFATFSNYSQNVVAANPVTSPGAAIDLILPGVNILSTYPGGTLASASGTIMACPHAAGLVARYIALKGRAANAAEVYAIRQALIDAGKSQISPEGLKVQNDPDSNKENLGWAGSPGPLPPIANAGDDQTVYDSDGNGCVDVTLDGSQSYDPDSSESLTYAWDIGGDGSIESTEVSFTAFFEVSDQDYTVTVVLTVTDADELSNHDTVRVTVNPNRPPVANAGMDQLIVDEDNNGSEVITLNGSGSYDPDPDGSIKSYEWLITNDSGTSYSLTGETPSIALAVGTYTATLTVTDNAGAPSIDSTVITVQSPSSSTETMHVANLIGTTQVAGKSGKWEAVVTVTVLDKSGTAVANATVQAAWSGSLTGSVSGLTGSNGQVTFNSGKLSGPGSVIFGVNGLSHDLLVYDAPSNVVDSITISYP